jgi:hypothetical protein
MAEILALNPDGIQIILLIRNVGFAIAKMNKEGQPQIRDKNVEVVIGFLRSLTNNIHFVFLTINNDQRNQYCHKYYHRP